MCCHWHGQIINYSTLGQSLDVTHPTLKRHIDILEATFMMRRLPLLQPRGIYGFFRTRIGQEIDLVVERRGKRLGFEFKTSSSPALTRGNKAAAEILQLDKLFLIIPQGNAYPIDADKAWVTPLEQLARYL